MSDTAAQPELEPSDVPPGEFPDDLAGAPPLDPHQAVIEEVAAARLEELREDGFDILPADAGETGEGESPAPELGGDLDGTPREPLPGEPLYTVKVDGQERQVPLSEITTSYQIQDAARNRLDRAEAIMRQAQETQPSVQGQPAATAPVAQQQPRDDLDGIDFNGVAERLQYGEGDDAGNALKDLVVQLRDRGRSSGGPAAAPEQVELRVLEKIEWVTALNRFGEDYQDILADAHVGGIAGSIGRALYHQAIQDAQMSGRPRRPYWDIFREAGEKTREWRNGLTGQQAGDSGEPAPPKPNGEQPTVALSPERGQRKRPAPQPPAPRPGPLAGSVRRGGHHPARTSRHSASRTRSTTCATEICAMQEQSRHRSHRQRARGGFAGTSTASRRP